jgi:hypothetical protein
MAGLVGRVGLSWATIRQAVLGRADGANAITSPTAQAGTPVAAVGPGRRRRLAGDE